ncbi:MAG: hypothetical protein U0869_25225 [Chloroflexota bacterium]
MTPIDRFERRLPDELQELAAERFPDYTNDLLARTARTRQRPAWSLPMRWLPMTIALRRPLLAPPMRLLAVGLALLLALLAALAVGGVLLNPRPAPVLPAVVATSWKNGLLAFARDGDIWVADPATGGEPRVLIGGGETDDYPDWSPDGSQIAFWRTDGAAMVLMVADADGSNVRQVTPDRVINPTWSEWSPDGSTFAITSTVKRMPAAWTIAVDQGEPRPIVTDMPISSIIWLPDGTGMVVRGSKDGLTGLYPVSFPGLEVGDPIIQSDPTAAFYANDRGFGDFQGRGSPRTDAASRCTPGWTTGTAHPGSSADRTPATRCWMRTAPACGGSSSTRPPTTRTAHGSPRTARAWR